MAGLTEQSRTNHLIQAKVVVVAAVPVHHVETMVVVELASVTDRL